MATEDRSALRGLEKRLFQLVSSKATPAQWAEWLRAPLEHALAGGDKKLALTLLKAGANGGAGWKGCDGRTLLDAAAEGGSEGIVSKLLDAGARGDLNAVSGETRMTALHRACENGHTAEAQVLLVEGADVGPLDSKQRSALHCALEGGHEELASRVIAAGADLNSKDVDGDTPLHLAAMKGCDRVASVLLRRGVGVDVANNDERCPLHFAVLNDEVDVAEVLLNAGADLNRRFDGDGVEEKCSPLYLARRNVAMTKVLLKHGADFNGVDSIGFTTLHWATGGGTPSVIDALVEAGSDVEARSADGSIFNGKYEFDGFTPLHYAAAHDKLDAMAALLRNGANINVIDNDGQTPLHVVCRVSPEHPSSVLKTADFLLRRGADETITDKDGHTPEDLIESSVGTGSLQQLLANAPADRTWRRRGMLVMCRAHSAKILGGVGDGKAGKVRRQPDGVGAGTAADGDGADGERCLLTRVVRLEADEVFRTILRFL